MRNIAISILDGFHYRYFVETQILKFLCQRYDKVIILAPNFLCEQLHLYMLQNSIHNFTHHTVVDIQLQFLQKIYLKLYFYICSDLTTETVNNKIEILKKSLIPRLLILLTNNVIFKNFLTRFIFNKFKYIFFIPNINIFKFYYNIFRSNNIQQLLVSTPAQKFNDIPILYISKLLKIPSSCYVYSWDNLTAKGAILLKPDKLYVWNKFMKNEALRFHGYNDSDVEVVGSPIADIYNQVIISNIKKTNKVKNILIATVPVIYYGNAHLDLALYLSKYFLNNKEFDCIITIRPHPLDTTDYSIVKKYPNINLDKSGSQDILEKWVPENNHAYDLGLLLNSADVVINVASTIAIDAACFDVPVINLAFQICENVNDENINNVKRYYNYTHYRIVVESNATTIVHNREELITGILHCLSEPQFKKIERENLRTIVMGNFEGFNSQNFVNKLVD